MNTFYILDLLFDCNSFNCFEIKLQQCIVVLFVFSVFFGRITEQKSRIVFESLKHKFIILLIIWKRVIKNNMCTVQLR